MQMLQAHVESELDAMVIIYLTSFSVRLLSVSFSLCDQFCSSILQETSQTDSVSQEQIRGTVEDRDSFQGINHVIEQTHESNGECRTYLSLYAEPGMNSRPKQSVLVLGDEPRYRRRREKGGDTSKRISSTFNHCTCHSLSCNEPLIMCYSILFVAIYS